MPTLLSTGRIGLSTRDAFSSALLRPCLLQRHRDPVSFERGGYDAKVDNALGFQPGVSRGKPQTFCQDFFSIGVEIRSEAQACAVVAWNSENGARDMRKLVAVAVLLIVTLLAIAQFGPPVFFSGG
jgi:hypothetical protein